MLHMQSEQAAASGSANDPVPFHPPCNPWIKLAKEAVMPTNADVERELAQRIPEIRRNLGISSKYQCEAHLYRGDKKKQKRWSGTEFEENWDPDEDDWELYYLPDDFSQATNIAELHPEKLAELRNLFWQEAERNKVLPLLGCGACG